jgi:tetratricopeptide (TPR) repeat protein/MinD-like ATPase involved in chromosome partitioning or flagellar assembly
MSRIVTFYSYKGGVGRTSAMANVAVLLAKYGKSVLLMDWDLEAPGLDRYFKAYIKAESNPPQGLIHMLTKAVEEPTTAWEPFVTQIEIDGCPTISIIMSGDRSTDYIERIRNFSWSDFFENRHGGATLDRWRTEWKSKYDYVLVDSRTGITDIGGVCTVFLPDILVLVFVANEQSFEGGLQVANGIQQSRRNLAVPRAPLAVLPLPGRFDGRDEVDEANAWLDRFSQDLKPFYDDWLPKQFEPRRILELTKVPYITKFSFGEPLSVLVHNVSDPEFPGFYLDNVARLIASDFADALQILSPRTSAYHNTVSEIRSKLNLFPIDEASIYHLLRLLEDQVGNNVELCGVLNETGVALLRQGRFGFAEDCLRRALVIAANLRGPSDPIAMFSWINLARLLHTKGNLAEAEDLYREALNRLRDTSRPGDPALNRVYMNLASLLHEKGNLAEAEDLYREALNRLRDTSQPGDPALNRVYNNLASLLREKGKLVEAEDLYREALHRLLDTSQPDYPALSRAYYNLGRLLHEKGNLAEAEDLYREALNRPRPGDPALSRAYYNLGRLLHEKGNLAEAEDLYREALNRLRDTSRPSDPVLSRVYNNLGRLLREKGNLADAEDLYREASRVFETISKRGSPQLAEAQSNLAEILVHTGKLNEAKSLMTDTLAMLERLRDQEHPAVIRARSNLAALRL